MHAHAHACTRMHTHTHTHTLSALHPNQCGPSFHTIQEADWKEKKLAVFHVFRERIGKRRGYSPKSRGRGHPREPFTKISAQKERLASQSAYEVDRVTDPVPIWEGGKENWEMAGHRMGAACVPPLAPTGSEFPVRWVETAEGSRTWAILLVSKNVAVEREDPQPTSCPHTPRSQGLDCQGRNEARRRVPAGKDLPTGSFTFRNPRRGESPCEISPKIPVWMPISGRQWFATVNLEGFDSTR